MKEETIMGNMISLYHDFLSAQEAQTLLHKLLPSGGLIKWEQYHLQFQDKKVPVPRLIAWYGERTYGYSGVEHPPLPLLPELQELQQKVEQVAGWKFNSVLLNYYQDGKNHINWHADKETELGLHPCIASVSLGVARAFQLKPRYMQRRTTKADIITIPLGGGSLLLMKPGTQANFVHRVLKDEGITEPRINLTFRKII